MRKYKAAFVAMCGVLASLALTIGVASAGAICVFAFHQPKVPQGMSKFKKDA
jgi:cyclic lactone autoinducer peptide